MNSNISIDNKNTYILGKTGSGKTWAMAELVSAQIKSGKQIILLDPLGDLSEFFLNKLTEEERAEVVKIEAKQASYVNREILEWGKSQGYKGRAQEAWDIFKESDKKNDSQAIDLLGLMEEGKSIILNLHLGVLGHELAAASLFLSLLVLKKAKTPKKLYVFADELQIASREHYAKQEDEKHFSCSSLWEDTISSGKSENKYFCLAHQYIDQINPIFFEFIKGNLDAFLLFQPAFSEEKNDLLNYSQPPVKKEEWEKLDTHEFLFIEKERPSLVEQF